MVGSVGVFFDACPEDIGCIFVVIQHLSPDGKGLMNELLARHAAMPVCMVSEGLKPEKNKVYLIPAGITMTITADGSHKRNLNYYHRKAAILFRDILSKPLRGHELELLVQKN